MEETYLRSFCSFCCCCCCVFSSLNTFILKEFPINYTMLLIVMQNCMNSSVCEKVADHVTWLCRLWFCLVTHCATLVYAAFLSLPKDFTNSARLCETTCAPHKDGQHAVMTTVPPVFKMKQPGYTCSY